MFFENISSIEQTSEAQQQSSDEQIIDQAEFSTPLTSNKEDNKLSLGQIVFQFEKDFLAVRGKSIASPEFNPGDTVKVSEKIGVRLQSFSGVVIKITNRSSRSTFTVRKTGNDKIEKTFSIYSPHIIEVKVLRHGLVRRAKLYYLRNLSGKKARIKEKLYGIK